MTDLEWLARNVHEWPTEPGEIGNGLFAMYFREDVFVIVRPLEKEWILESQWLAKRAELQNKPSWDCAPEWANWLAQDGTTGNWFWYRKKPRHQKGEGNERFEYRNVMLEGARLTGEVLGNWQDTLEERPEIAAICEAAAKLAETACSMVRIFTDDEIKEMTEIAENVVGSIKDKELTAEWNGEGLPSVGCMVIHSGWSINPMEVVYVDHKNQEACIQGNDGLYAVSIDEIEPPPETERQKAVKELSYCLRLPLDGHSADDCMDIADYLYDHGYRKTT